MFEALRLDAAAVAAQEEAIRQQVRELDDRQRKQYYEQFRREMKDPDTYATLNYFFLAGLHHMYLGDFLRGGINLTLLVVGLGLCVFGQFLLGLFVIGLILATELMALFRSQTVVAQHNNEVALAILEALTEAGD